MRKFKAPPAKKRKDTHRHWEYDAQKVKSELAVAECACTSESMESTKGLRHLTSDLNDAKDIQSSDSQLRFK
eukprot:3414066-Amphidinium_carterae.2